MFKRFLFLLFTLNCCLIQAQNDSVERNVNPALPIKYYRASVRCAVTVPHPVGNKSFRKSFVGIYEVGGAMNFFLYKGLFAGITYKNGLLKITENKIPDYNASMAINNWGVKVGNDWYVGERNRLIYSLALTIGNSKTKFSGLIHKDTANKAEIPSKFSSNYLEPEMSLFFLVEPDFSIGLHCAYTILNANFNPYELALNEFADFENNNSTASQWFSFGFSLYYNIGKIKKNYK